MNPSPNKLVTPFKTFLLEKCRCNFSDSVRLAITPKKNPGKNGLSKCVCINLRISHIVSDEGIFCPGKKCESSHLYTYEIVDYWRKL
jgi:hypothetical protein